MLDAEHAVLAVAPAVGVDDGLDLGLMGRRIECLLIGGRIPDHMNDIVVKWDSEGEAPTMVRFLTWETLLTRAERACELSGPRPGSRPRAVDVQALAAQ